MPTTWIGLIAAVILGLISIIGFGVRAIVKGDLVPRSTVEKNDIKTKETFAREREIQQFLVLSRDDAVRAQQETASQMAALVAEQRTTTEVVLALKKAADLTPNWIGSGHS